MAITSRRRKRKLADIVKDGLLECNICLNFKNPEDFAKDSSSRIGRKPQCRECVRWESLTRKYGVTKTKYFEMLDDQNGACALCNLLSDKLVVDHDHRCCPGQKTCGKCIRALLCYKCNTFIGLGNDSIERLMGAAAYLVGFENVLGVQS